MHLYYWDNRFSLIYLVLHELQDIHKNLLCLAFQHLPVNWILVFWPVMCWAWKVTQEYLHLHRSSLQKHIDLCAQDFTHSSICEMSLGSVTVAMPEVGHFVKSLQPHINRVSCFPQFNLERNCSHLTARYRWIIFLLPILWGRKELCFSAPVLFIGWSTQNFYYSDNNVFIPYDSCH